jgi:hypothetical protein
MSSFNPDEDEFDGTIVLHALAAVQEATLQWLFEHGAIESADMIEVLARAKKICAEDDDCDTEAASAFIDAAFPILNG